MVAFPITFCRAFNKVIGSSLPVWVRFRSSGSATNLTLVRQLQTATMAPVVPKHGLLFRQTAKDIETRTKTILQHAQQVLDHVADVNTPRTYEATIKPLALLDSYLSLESTNCTFLQYVGAEKDVSDMCVESNKLIDEFEIDASMRKDVYEAVKAVNETINRSSLTAEQARYLDFTMVDFKRNGLHLDPETQAKLVSIKKDLSLFAVDFSKNVNEDTTSVLLTREELDGLPDDYFEGREIKKTKREDGTEYDAYVITMKYPDIVPALSLCKVPATRKKLDFINGSRCKPNVEIFQKTLKLRDEAAKILGYENHASFILDRKMAKTVENVTNFLSSLREKLIPFAKEELKVLLELKQKELEDNLVEKNELNLLRKSETYNKIESYDYNYYNKLLLQSKYAVDDEKIKEYYSLETVTEGMLKIYEQVLSLKFVEIVKTDPKYDAWHQDVRIFQVFDQVSKESNFLGTFYLDLHPRDNKYSHAAVFPLQPGCLNEDGTRQYPVCAMLANFSKPTLTRPSLLKHNETVTFFHELGHVMHGICSNKPTLARFHGTRVERDFVEAPSQMLENWCWDSKILKSLSKHVKTGEQIPDETIKSMVDSKNVNAALFNLRQIFFGWFDMTVHTDKDPGSIDSTELWATLRPEITLVPSLEGVYPVATFGHIMGGYDAGYYGYLWSLVYSADMFYTCFKENPLDKAQGLKYRNEVIGVGGSRDAIDSLRAFLGREPQDDSFLESIGLKK